jgi:putative NADH-flavin reductase
MSNVLILGANGSVARVAIDLFLKQTDATLTLYLRDPRKLTKIDSDRVHVVQGDVLDTKKLENAMARQDVVYANLAGYETTQKGEPFRGGVVSRKSVASLVVKLAQSPQLEVRRSLGVSKPER